jgi:hypothetical protein
LRINFNKNIKNNFNEFHTLYIQNSERENANQPIVRLSVSVDTKISKMPISSLKSIKSWENIYEKCGMAATSNTQKETSRIVQLGKRVMTNENDTEL